MDFQVVNEDSIVVKDDGLEHFETHSAVMRELPEPP
jgi:hypothetical protein